MIWASRIFSSRRRAGKVTLLGIAAAVFQMAGWGATVSGRVELVLSHDPNVRKHRDYSGVVVWLEPVSAPPAIPVKLRTAHVLPILVGTVVNFPNNDPIFHNAFSNYDGQIFDIGLYAPGTSRSIAFHREGVVRVFCNIHPAMSAVIVALKSPYFGTSGASGGFEIEDVPPGSYRMRVFHERATEQTLDQLTRVLEVSEGHFEISPISVSESGYLQVPHKNKYGRDYQTGPDPGSYLGTRP
jgi:hypothetical protein